MEDNKKGISDVIEKYKPDVEILCKYLDWLEKQSGKNLSTNYKPENGELTMKVPVYDSTLLNFVKTANKTKFMNRNYIYTFSRFRLKTVEDELRFIEKAQIMDMQYLGDILSKYILKGMTKGNMWTDAMKTGVFFKTVKKMKELIEFWTVPM